MREGKRGGDGGFEAKDARAERTQRETGRAQSGAIRGAPAAFGTEGEGDR